MAYSDSFPATRPVFQADFANGGRVDPRISYSRSTTGTYFGTEKHLSSENLLLQSQDFDTTWVTADVTLTGSQSAPDGSSTAWTLTPGTINSPHLIQQDVAITANQQYTAAAHIKSGAATHGFIALRAAYGVYCYAELEFSTSTLTTGGTGWTGVSGTSTALGNGWFKITLTGTSPSSFLNPNLKIGIGDGNAYNAAGHPTWTSTGTETMYAWGAQLNTTGATVYDSPTTTQIAREYQTKLQTAAINAPRFEYSPTDSASMGLLIEGQSTNKATYSEDFTNGVYTGYRASVDSSAAIAPSGELTADLLREDSTASNTHFIAASTATGLSVGSTQYTVSVFVKAAGRSRFRMFDNNQNTSGDSTFDLSNGTVVAGSGAIESCGNGWYRCSITPTCDYSSNSVVYILLDDGSGTSYTGNGFSGLLLWGYQLETGQTFASSPIATNGSAVTRAADSASVDLSAINQDPIGTDIALATEFRCNVVDTNFRRIAEMRRSSGSGLHKSHQVYNGTAYSYATDTSGTNQVLKSIVSLGDSSHKLVSTQSGASAFAAGDGVAGNTKTSTAEDMVYDRLYIGSDGAGVRQLDGHISRIALYGNSISETNATALSS